MCSSVDGLSVGGPSQLRFLPVGSIESMQFLDPQQASSRFGFDHVNGAVLVVTRVGTTSRDTAETAVRRFP